MGYTVENIISNDKYAIVKFVFSEPFTSTDMTNVLGLINKMLALEKPFAFYVDTRNADKPPSDSASKLIAWLRANKPLFRKTLICSAIIYEKSIKNSLAVSLINAVFMVQKPTRPNHLFTNEDSTLAWIKSRVAEWAVSTHSPASTPAIN
jgi:hypothetical protein